MGYQVRRPSGLLVFEECFDTLQDAIEIVDVQAYYMERQYVIFNVDTGKEEYHTS